MKTLTTAFLSCARRTAFLMSITLAAGTLSRPAAATPMPATAPAPVVVPTPPPPPLAQAYVASEPPAMVSHGRLMVPLSFLSNGLGASSGPVGGGLWRIVFFNHSIDLYPYQLGARLDGQQVTLPVAPFVKNNTLYVPWAMLAEHLGVTWREVPSTAKTRGRSIFLLQYAAAYIEQVRHSVQGDKVRIVMTLSNPTRIVASHKGADVHFQIAAARRPNVPLVQPVNDYLVPRAVTRSGDWKAGFEVRLNYAAPVQWFTLGNPPRLVVDVRRLFEERQTNPMGGGLVLTKIRKGTAHGPVQLFVLRMNPREGWRVRVTPAGYSVLQRARPSRLARRHRALVAINGGFFAYDGAAVGALLINGEWIRLPWKARTAIGFTPDGSARIGNLQARAIVDFSSGLSLPIRDLNGWPDKGVVTVLTSRFGSFYKLVPGEIAVEVKDGTVVSKPGGGGAHIYAGGFTLVASGAGRPWLDKVARGEKAKLSVQSYGWADVTSALGGGPRLLANGHLALTDVREDFRSDVRVGLGPRTAMGIDRQGHYIIVVVDGRQPWYSSGLTLTELAYTMQQLGAVDALNLDGGGSTVMAIRGNVINRPSDGSERSVSNALLVMR